MIAKAWALTPGDHVVLFRSRFDILPAERIEAVYRFRTTRLACFEATDGWRELLLDAEDPTTGEEQLRDLAGRHWYVQRVAPIAAAAGAATA